MIEIYSWHRERVKINQPAVPKTNSFVYSKLLND